MTDAKTVQQRIAPITVKCAAAGCTAKAEAAASFKGDGDDYDVIAPRGWSFAKKDPRSNAQVVYGACPAHAKK
jgi:hypothetical protein